MAVDLKYGRVTVEHGNIPDDEPVVVFRAQDRLLPKVLAYYMMASLRAGSPQAHLSAIARAYRFVQSWQWTHITKVPDTAPAASDG